VADVSKAVILVGRRFLMRDATVLVSVDPACWFHSRILPRVSAARRGMETSEGSEGNFSPATLEG